MKDDDKQIRAFWHMARGFIYEYLPKVRCLSTETAASYKTSLKAFLDYITLEHGVPRNKTTFGDFSRDRLKAFTIWLADVKGLAPKSINLRMTAIKSFLKYCSEEDVTLTAFYIGAKSIRGLKTSKKPIRYMTRVATTSLLNALPGSTPKERRDKMILIFMYDTAARVQEIADVVTNDIHIDARHPFVTLRGKGGKTRNVPLMHKTIAHIRGYLKEFHPDRAVGSLFYSNRYGAQHALSTDSISLILKDAARRARQKCDEVPDDIHCHLVRKTRAMDLYHEGVSLPIVMQILGHESISTTTGFYAFATMGMMYAEMEKAHPDIAVEQPKWKDQQFLDIIYSLD
jgi:site-specific recombinase XerD